MLLTMFVFGHREILTFFSPLKGRPKVLTATIIFIRVNSSGFIYS